MKLLFFTTLIFFAGIVTGQNIKPMYTDSAAIVDAGFFFRQSSKALTASIITGTIGGLFIGIAPATMYYQTDPKTGVQTLQDGNSTMLYTIGGLCSAASIISGIYALNRFGKGARALELRVNPQSASIKIKF